MSGARARHAGHDFVPVLHNCGPSTSTVAVSGAVGQVVHCAPQRTIAWLMAEAGVDVARRTLGAPAHDSRMHPAWVAAACGVALRMVATSRAARKAYDDTGLVAALKEDDYEAQLPVQASADQALERLAALPPVVKRVVGGWRFYGLVQWRPHTAQHDIGARDAFLSAHTRRPQALLELSVVAFASPPILTLRRAPTLEYFRCHGSLELRHFSTRKGA